MAPRVQSLYELLGLKPKASSSEPSVDFYSHQRAYNERQRQRKEARTRQREAAALQRETAAMQQNFSRAFFQDHPEVHITRQLRPQVECEEKEKAKPISISIIKAPLPTPTPATPTPTSAAGVAAVATPDAATVARRKTEPKKEKVGNENSGGRSNPQPAVAPLRPCPLSPEQQLRAEIERLQRAITEHRVTWKQAWDKEKGLLEEKAHLELELERLREERGGVEALKAAVNTQLAEVDECHQKARQHKDSLGKAIKTLEAALTSARNASVVLQANTEEEAELEQQQKQEKKRRPWAAFKGLLRINKNKDEEKKQKKNTKK